MPENIGCALVCLAEPAHFRLRLFLEGLLIGALTGAVIALYHVLLEGADCLRPEVYAFLRTAGPLWTVGWFLFLWGLSFIVWRMMRLDSMVGGGGIPDIKGILRGETRLRWARVLVGKFVGVVLSIGAGLSLGRGGPSVELGACVGAGVSRTAGRSNSEERFLLTAGAGAGFAAIFNAPLASLVFSFEELAKNFSQQVLMGVLGAAIAAGFVTQEVFGVGPMFAVGPVAAVPLGEMYLLLFALGIFSGGLGRLFNAFLLRSLAAWARLRVPDWLRVALPFLAAGILGFFLPDILSGGNFLVNRLVLGQVMPAALFLLLIGKFLFTAVCYGSGVPGGIFLPVLVLGALSGAVFAAGAAALGFLPPDLCPTFIIFGMAGFFSGSIKAPVTGSVFIMEITGSFEHLLAVVCVAAAAVLVNDLTGGRPVYDELYERSRRLREGEAAKRGRHVMAEIHVGAGSRLANRTIAAIPWPPRAHVLNVRRGSEELLPQGSLRLLAGDFLYVLTDERDLHALEQAASEGSSLAQEGAERHGEEL